MNLEDKTHAGKLHPVILQKLDDDDDQPMLRLHVVMPFHKGDPMSNRGESNFLCKFRRPAKEALAITPWLL